MRFVHRWNNIARFGNSPKPRERGQACASELLADLEKRKEFGLLTQIHLDENEIDAAFGTLEKAQRAFPYALSRAVQFYVTPM